MSSPQDSAPERRSSSPGVASITSRIAPDESKASLIRRRVPFLFSVRFGITAWYAGVLILTIAVLGISFRMLLVRALEQDSEERLMAAAVEVRSHTDEAREVNRDEDQANVTYVRIVPNFDVEPILLSGISVKVVDRTGRELIENGTYSRLWPQEDQIEELLTEREPVFTTIRVNGYNIRGLAYPLFSESSIPSTDVPDMIGMIFTAESLQTTTRMLNQLNQVLLVSGIFGGAIASIGGWVLAGRALAPVNRIMTSADDIAKDRSAASLSRRLEVPQTGDEIAQLAETFNDMLDRIEQAFAAQRRFVADASHELRTPLTSIKGNIDVLRRQIQSGRMPHPDDISEALGDVGRESARMGRLVEDLLSLARNESQGSARTSGIGVVSLDVLAREAVRTAESLVRGQTLRLEAPEPVTLHGSGDQLVQVMLILLDNAIRHTPPAGRIVLRISQDIDPVDMVDCARIDVEDSGQGISREHLPHLFERFYRAEGARDRHSGGTGLGLAIALAIVRAHSGWIDVESAPEQGTHFTVWIPLQEEDHEHDPATGASRLKSRLPRRKPVSAQNSTAAR